MKSDLEQFLSAIERNNNATADLNRDNPLVLVESEAGPVGLRLTRRKGRFDAKIELSATQSLPIIGSHGLQDPEMCRKFMVNYQTGSSEVGTLDFFLQPSVIAESLYVAAMRFDILVRDKDNLDLSVWSPGPVNIVPLNRNAFVRAIIESRAAQKGPRI